VIDFLVGAEGGRPFTSITCLRGSVDVRSADPSVEGVVSLSPGQMVTVFQGREIEPPRPAPVFGPRAAQRAAQRAGAQVGEAEAEAEGGPAGAEEGDAGPLEETRSAIDEAIGDITAGGVGSIDTTSTLLSPVELEPETGKTTPVKVDVRFPQ
jgi:hypothetical protein